MKNNLNNDVLLGSVVISFGVGFLSGSLITLVFVIIGYAAFGGC